MYIYRCIAGSKEARGYIIALQREEKEEVGGENTTTKEHLPVARPLARQLPQMFVVVVVVDRWREPRKKEEGSFGSYLFFFFFFFGGEVKES